MKRLLFALILAPIAMQAAHDATQTTRLGSELLGRRRQSPCLEARKDMMKAFRQYLKANPSHKYVKDYKAAQEHLKNARKNIMGKLPEMKSFQDCVANEPAKRQGKRASVKRVKTVQSRNQ